MPLRAYGPTLAKNHFDKSTNVGYIQARTPDPTSKLGEVPFLISIALLVWHERPCLSMISFRSSSKCVGDNLVHRKRPEHCESVYNQKAMLHKAAMLNGSAKTASLWR
jgi:hypothetical protein